MRFLARIVANSLGILLSSLAIPGFTFTGNFKTLVLAGLLLALANAVIRPILKLLSLPLIFLTFGLFLIVINMLVLKIVDYFFDTLHISLGALFWGSLLISIINGIALVFIRQKNKT